MSNKPTQEELLDETGLKSVDRDFDDDWRHGGTVVEIFHREADNTYWQVCYRKSTDGEWNGLRENDYDCIEVMPVETTVVEYQPFEE